MCGFVLAAVFYVATVGLGAAQAVVADLPVPSGGTERAAFLAAPQARATVVLLAGGEGIVPIDNAGNSGNQNFLIRTRTMWQRYAINAVILASPNGSSLLGQRAQPAYAAALANRQFRRQMAVDRVRIGLAAGGKRIRTAGPICDKDAD
jgi:hypothetical protein